MDFDDTVKLRGIMGAIIVIVKQPPLQMKLYLMFLRHTSCSQTRKLMCLLTNFLQHSDIIWCFMFPWKLEQLEGLKRIWHHWQATKLNYVTLNTIFHWLSVWRRESFWGQQPIFWEIQCSNRYPDQDFLFSSISTCIWIQLNHKDAKIKLNRHLTKADGFRLHFDWLLSTQTW